MYNFWKKEWKIYIDFQQSGNGKEYIFESRNGKGYTLPRSKNGQFNVHFLECVS